MSVSSKSAEVVVYTKPGCPFCTLAINLLKSKNINFEVVDVFSSVEGIKSFKERTKGATSFPQIIINNILIGGYDDLSKLDASDALDNILSG